MFLYLVQALKGPIHIQRIEFFHGHAVCQQGDFKHVIGPIEEGSGTRKLLHIPKICPVFRMVVPGILLFAIRQSPTPELDADGIGVNRSWKQICLINDRIVERLKQPYFQPAT